MGVQKGIRIFLETGNRWVFAGAIDWPGWCRRGKDEAGAMQALLEAGSRYSQALSAGTNLVAPESIDRFEVVERVIGNATTDFGAPDAALDSDQDPVDTEDLARFQTILKGCWMAFDRAVDEAEGRELRKGPRGGGRDLAKIVDHLVDGDASYLGRIGWKAPKDADASRHDRINAMRQVIIEGLEASARGELPAEGPRGGLRWTTRRFVRRVAWHTLDHAWEIEDRLV